MQNNTPSLIFLDSDCERTWRPSGPLAVGTKLRLRQTGASFKRCSALSCKVMVERVLGEVGGHRRQILVGMQLEVWLSLNVAIVWHGVMALTVR